MPLPVERSQGSVSSLVARFQTAADRDQEQARRQSLPPRRLSSNTSIRKDPSIPSAETSVPPPTTSKDGGSDMKDESSSGELNGAATTPATATDTTDKPEKKESLMDKGKDLVKGVKELTGGGSSDAKEANEVMAKDNISVNPAPVTPQKSNQAKKVSTNGTKTPRNGSQVTPKSTSVSEVEGSVTKSASQTTSTARTEKGSIREASPSPSRTKRAFLSPVVSKVKDKALSTDSLRNTASPQKKDTSSAPSKPSPARGSPSTSSAAKPPSTKTQRLVPSATGPPRQSTTTPASGHSVPSPLKPHITGTPSKPTASFLAKTRSPPVSTSTPTIEKRASTSIRRSSGTGPRDRVGSASPSPATASTSKSPIPRTSSSAPGSRLLQGTAASRAKAAELKSPPSTVRSKAKPRVSVASTDSSPSKPVSKAGGPSPAGSRILPGTRIGLAGAGVGKGGKTGKEYNDEVNAKLKAGQTSTEKVVEDANEREPTMEQSQGEPSTNGLSSSEGSSGGNGKNQQPPAQAQRAVLPGMRIGLAGAGAGKGGKMGKDYNDELSAKLKTGEMTGQDIVTQADGQTFGGNGVAHELQGDVPHDENRLHNGNAARPGQEQGGQPCEGVVTVDDQSALGQGTSKAIDGQDEPPASGDSATAHKREVSSDSVGEIPDL